MKYNRHGSVFFKVRRCKSFQDARFPVLNGLIKTFIPAFKTPSPIWWLKGLALNTKSHKGLALNNQVGQEEPAESEELFHLAISSCHFYFQLSPGICWRAV